MINPRRIDLNLLDLLLQIYDSHSVSVAGANLGLSQPATSNALARLRQMLGDPLFIRGARGMEPTPFTERIVPDIREHLSGIASVLNDATTFDASNSKRTFRLSLSGLGEQVFLAPLARHVFARAPGIRLENASSPFLDLYRTLATRESEMAIGLLEMQNAQLRQMHLFDEDYRVVGPPGLSHQRAANLDLCRERIVMAVPSLTYADDVEQVLAERGLAENVCMRIRNFGALPELLSTLNAFAIVPGYLGRRMVEAGQATMLDMTLPRGRQKVQLVWHINTMQDPGCIWLRAQIRELFQSRDICQDAGDRPDRP
ncbi:LysR family transcriptional regulator [Phaeobacter sp. HF9A]|uniref:LysR family transcriptional regulator n=1 Tax=Phaeobacter sp. HF9A TaxID=2721561 RepID=UPI00142F56AC|nr:LysR family transcriptional regulator [Phaeobacter sp. HF9A]NIZ12283.1 LysR family transcriptional regulator [Phaeobacter sp. HF9A]